MPGLLLHACKDFDFDYSISRHAKKLDFQCLIQKTAMPGLGSISAMHAKTLITLYQSVTFSSLHNNVQKI